MFCCNVRRAHSCKQENDAPFRAGKGRAPLSIRTRPDEHTTRWLQARSAILCLINRLQPAFATCWSTNACSKRPWRLPWRRPGEPLGDMRRVKAVHWKVNCVQWRFGPPAVSMCLVVNKPCSTLAGCCCFRYCRVHLCKNRNNTVVSSSKHATLFTSVNTAREE